MRRVPSILRAPVAVAALVAPLALVAGLLIGSPNEAESTDPLCLPGFSLTAEIGCARVVNGLIEVRLENGNTVYTHGPDTIPAQEGDVVVEQAAERNVSCEGTNRFRVLYAYQAGTENRAGAVTAELQGYVRKMNAILHREAVETGSTSGDFRFVCDANGQPSVTAVQVGTDVTYGGIVNAAQNAGFNDRARKYMIFGDFRSPGGYSGVGGIFFDERAGQDNPNNRGPSYGITYGGFWGSSTPMHEAGHNLGAVQRGAPDSSGAGHCDGYGSSDVLCYNDGGSQWDDSHICAVPDPRPHFDACHNDFFAATPIPGTYLATSWNVASNVFLKIGGDVTTTTTASTTTTTAPTTTTVPPSTTTTTTRPPRTCRIFIGRTCISR